MAKGEWSAGEIKIHKNIKIPPREQLVKHMRSGRAADAFPYHDFKVGDCIDVPKEKYKPIMALMRRYAKKNGWELMLLHDGSRLWRTK